MIIRNATKNDIQSVIQITKENQHFWSEAVDGAEALARIIERPNNMFLVCERDDELLGFVLGTWDGARAYIHKISVRQNAHKKGVGTMLVNETVEYFRKIGAPTVAVAAADGTHEDEENDSTGFWRKVGFEPIPARLMIKFNIQEDLNDNK